MLFGKLYPLQRMSFFLNSGTLWGLLVHRLASHKCLLTVTVLTGNSRLSLTSLELIIGWVFAILAIDRSIRTVVFRFLPRLSGFAFHLKPLEIILAEQPMIFCTSLYVFPSLINFLIRLRCSSLQCPIFGFGHREFHGQHVLASSLNKGKLNHTCFFPKRMNSLIGLYTAIILNTLLSIIHSITQTQEYACQEC